MANLKSDMAAFQKTFLGNDPASSSVQDNWDTFKTTINNLTDKHIPSKTSRASHSSPWITQEVRRMSKKKQRLYNKARVTNDPRDWKSFKEYQKAIQKKQRQNYWKFQDSMFKDDDKSNKTFWKFIKSKKQDSSNISSLKDGSKIIFSSKGKATSFNEQFRSVFTSENTTTMPDMGPSMYPTADHINVTCDGVLKLLKDLKINKATGPDAISARILKDLADEVAPVLTFIFQQSLDTGDVPSDWRQANISPIYKKGDRSVPSNYRPVSITSICCKVIEHIICSHVLDLYDNHNILVDAQHGFRAGRSCETQLIITCHDLAKSLDDRQQVDAVVLDFSKAFDRVPHQRLLLKLQHYGIRDSLLLWINNFLTKRAQRVVVDGESSDSVPVTSGVPQGTVLGPLLFLSFINDLPSGITSKIRLFADDCLLYRPISDAADSTALQEDLNTLHNWSNTWNMKFNTEKCHTLRITLRRNVIDANYHLGGSMLTMVSEYPYLGLTLTNNMSWQNHINNITSRATRMLGLIQRNLRGSPRKLRQQAYLSLVRPHLEYCSSVWNPYTKKSVTSIENIQRRAARFVLNKYRRRESVTEMIKDLQWDSLESRRQAASLFMMYRIHTQQVAINCSDYLTPMIPSSTRSYHPQKYQLIPSRIQVFQYSYFPRTVIWWNALPGEVVASASFEAFKGGVAANI